LTRSHSRKPKPLWRNLSARRVSHQQFPSTHCKTHALRQGDNASDLCVSTSSHHLYRSTTAAAHLKPPKWLKRGAHRFLRHLPVSYHQLSPQCSNADPHVDRLPTVSASQALSQLKARGPRAISTGLPQLDALLVGCANNHNGANMSGGLIRGKVTEIYGPPGAGKTTFG